MDKDKKSCPCHSEQLYSKCCKPFHDGTRLPENAELLMRSRYAAYALHLADYIIATTHPQNPSYMSDRTKWTRQILDFCKRTEFSNLKILGFTEDGVEAFVTFTAYLKQGGQDASFTEKSRFEKIGKQWLYRDATEWRS